MGKTQLSVNQPASRTAPRGFSALLPIALLPIALLPIALLPIALLPTALLPTALLPTALRHCCAYCAYCVTALLRCFQRIAHRHELR